MKNNHFTAKLKDIAHGVKKNIDENQNEAVRFLTGYVIILHFAINDFLPGIIGPLVLVLLAKVIEGWETYLAER